MTTRDPEWTEQDLLEVLALAEYRDSLCPCCELPKDAVWGHERDAPRFRVSKWQCLAGLTLAETQAAYFEGKQPSPAHASLKWSVRIDRR